MIMKNYEIFPDEDSIESFDKESCGINNIFNDTNSQFEECFTKIFVENKLFDIDSDNEEEGLNDKKKPVKNYDYAFLIEEKPELKGNSINSKENITKKTDDKSKVTINKNESFNIKKGVYNFSSLVSLSTHKEQSVFDNVKDKINRKKDKKSNSSLNKKEKQKKISNNCPSLLGKKRNIFRVVNPSEYAIFNFGGYSHYSRQIIDEIYNIYGKEKNGNNKNSVFKNSEITKQRIHKKKKLQKRKQNSDNIRKKIKARFLKSLKNTINRKLKMAGSTEFFNFLPQIFISNVSKEKNKHILDLTFKEIFSKKFIEDDKCNESDMKKYYHNLSVLEYLENNNEISEKSNFNIIKNMKYYQIFEEYLKSNEFEMEINNLKLNKENDKYIRNYIIKAINFIEFFYK